MAIKKDCSDTLPKGTGSKGCDVIPPKAPSKKEIARIQQQKKQAAAELEKLSECLIRTVLQERLDRDPVPEDYKNCRFIDNPYYNTAKRLNPKLIKAVHLIHEGDILGTLLTYSDNVEFVKA